MGMGDGGLMERRMDRKTNKLIECITNFVSVMRLKVSRGVLVYGSMTAEEEEQQMVAGVQMPQLGFGKPPLTMHGAVKAGHVAAAHAVF